MFRKLPISAILSVFPDVRCVSANVRRPWLVKEGEAFRCLYTYLVTFVL